MIISNKKNGLYHKNSEIFWRTGFTYVKSIIETIKNKAK